MSVEVYDQMLDELLYLKKDVIELFDELIHYPESQQNPMQTPQNKEKTRKITKQKSGGTEDLEITIIENTPVQDSANSESPNQISEENDGSTTPSTVKSKRGRKPGSLNKKVKVSDIASSPYILRSKVKRKIGRAHV